MNTSFLKKRSVGWAETGETERNSATTRSARVHPSGAHTDRPNNRDDAEEDTGRVVFQFPREADRLKVLPDDAVPNVLKMPSSPVRKIAPGDLPSTMRPRPPTDEQNGTRFKRARASTARGPTKRDGDSHKGRSKGSRSRSPKSPHTLTKSPHTLMKPPRTATHTRTASGTALGEGRCSQTTPGTMDRRPQVEILPAEQPEEVIDASLIPDTTVTVSLTSDENVNTKKSGILKHFVLDKKKNRRSSQRSKTAQANKGGAAAAVQSSPATQMRQQSSVKKFLKVAQKFHKVVQLSSGPKEVEHLGGHEGLISATCFAPDSLTLTTAAADGSVNIWDGQAVHRLLARVDPGNFHAGGGVCCASYSADSQLLVTVFEEGMAHVWMVATAGRYSVGASKPGVLDHYQRKNIQLPFVIRAPIASVADRSFHVTCCAFSPSVRRMALGGRLGMVRIYTVDPKRGRCDTLTTLPCDGQMLYTLAWSPNSHLIATGSYDATIKVWRIKIGRRLVSSFQLTKHTQPVRQVCFSANSKFLISCSEDCSVLMWDVSELADSSTPLRTITTHEHWVMSCCFSSRSFRVISASRDQIVKMTDVTTGQEVAVMNGPGDKFVGWITSCGVSPDGLRVVTGSAQGHVTVFSTPAAIATNNWKMSTVTNRGKPARIRTAGDAFIAFMSRMNNPVDDLDATVNDTLLDSGLDQSPGRHDTQSDFTVLPCSLADYSIFEG